MSGEKRRYERFENRALAIGVARPGIRGILRSNPSAECLNFSRTGLQFDSAQQLKTGESVLIDIEVDEIAVHDLKATVVSSVQTEQGAWCHGTRFCLEDTKSDAVFRDLLRIEDKLKTHKLYG